MQPRRSRHSIFSQRLDRAVFAVYLVGGVIPLAALFWVVRTYVLPGAEQDASVFWGWLVGLLSFGVLSLAAAFALRHLTASAIARMDSDNRRLAALLAASSELAHGVSAEQALGVAVSRAAELSGARAAVLFAAADKDLELKQAAGPDARAWFGARLDEARALAGAALENGAPEAAPAPRAAREQWIALPLRPGASARGALLLAGSPAALSSENAGAAQTLAGMAAGAIHRGELEDAQRNFFAHVTDLLVAALDAHVVGRAGHGGNVARIANRLAHEIDLPRERLERLHFAAMLHDIGMLKLEPARHRDPKAVRFHAAVGAKMLGRIRLWEPIAPIVLHHHEWWDGSGYPESRVGEDIPLESRIVAIADAVDAMRRPDGRRAGLALPEILAEVRNGRGTQFDPALVDAFTAIVERGELSLD
jgi:putative nucleotidyltransferase with HDIG domain